MFHSSEDLINREDLPKGNFPSVWSSMYQKECHAMFIYCLAIFSVYCDIIYVANQIILSIMDIDRMFTFCNKIIGCTKPF